MEEEIQAELNTFRNKFGRVVQVLKINDGIVNPKASRSRWISEDDALNYLENEFVFENGKEYRIKYLISNGWKSGTVFKKSNNTDLSKFVFSHEMEVTLYQNQGLVGDEIHIFSIEVTEVQPREEIEWDDILDN